mgnify:CR=1 FL=1
MLRRRRRRLGSSPRGVYRPAMSDHTPPEGSSPLARGLRPSECAEVRPNRIIPARAGFTLAPLLSLRPGPDHPRSRGVYPVLARPGSIVLGSSPLARGLRIVGLVGRPSDRIIPARAGFTRRRTSGCAGWWDHPRSRGVYNSTVLVRRAGGGSSPLARGLLVTGLPGPAARRIIPARAGFTRRSCSRPCAFRDHPRSRGVYPGIRRPPTAAAGSSPLARGLLQTGAQFLWSTRIIPARAGFTKKREREKRSCWDHPRSRGVYSRSLLSSSLRGGSSPLARGLHHDRRSGPSGYRIIPARAGFTSSSLSSSNPEKDHPRSRGVYCQASSSAGRTVGSSPLARGLLAAGAAILTAAWIIPARAGFTPGYLRE